jgi:metallo-beta-lactamase family protein
VLPDCGHLNEEEAAYANRKGLSRHDPALPLFTSEQGLDAARRIEPLEFDAECDLAPGVALRLSRAGHILGAASAHLTLQDSATVLFSGDLGRRTHPILTPPDPAPAADHIVIESTYGDRLHDSSSAATELGAAITHTIERGGSVLIPAFVVDRTEVVLNQLADLAAANAIPAHTPIYVDSPMALAALDVYREAVRRGDHDVRRDVRGSDLFAQGAVREVRTVEGSKALNNPAQPSIIISAAGMATGGRVVHHLANLLPDKRNTVILVGYQAVGTRGRQLTEGASEIKMLGRYVPVRARVVHLPQFSVHADAGELLGWLCSVSPAPRAVYVVHGEPGASRALADAARQALSCPTVVPHYAERVCLVTTAL